MRAFIAVEIPDEVKAKFEEAQGRLRRSGADVRWVKPANTHITLEFLGETPVEKIEEIKSVLSRVAATHGPFEVSIETLGVFPNVRRPRVVWIGITQGAQPLVALQASVNAQLREIGFRPEEREYSPHITLGRVRGTKNLEKLTSGLEAEKDFRAGEFHAAEVHLIRSVLSPEGPSYTKLLSAPLQSPTAGGSRG